MILIKTRNTIISIVRSSFKNIINEPQSNNYIIIANQRGDYHYYHYNQDKFKDA